MWTAAVVGAVTVYWFVWVMGSAEVKGKRTVNLKMGSIMRDKVQDKYKQFWSFFLRSKEGIAAASDDDNVPAFVDTFYNLVTDIYEWGWGQSFHFSPSLPGRSHREATRIHEEPLADMRDGDLISQIPIRELRSGAKFDRDLYHRYADPVRDHVPVMLGEVLDAFRSLRLLSFVDCTLGAAGHSAAIVDAHPELELFVGMDMDASIHDQARAPIEKLLAMDSRGSKLKAYTHVRNFKYIKSVLGSVDENLLDVGVNDILMDLGISSMQVDDSTRGFSVQGDGPLDMRMNPQASLTAEEILNSWSAAEVGKVLREYGEESNWQFIQNQIVEAHEQGGLHTTDELVHLVRRASSKSGGMVFH
ncbi:ribosomal RNA small subunit methyltransferase H-like [Zingiber officinale]|uniref:ribosomal RNA small subunit methyltransferase H-like n=1 Tax=Zingiber officinale TaxID=94328 RepID=UPI001C4B258E|nr:ribosomal RNA small subunit methyltransferase H-like [Zingiber officinale]